MEGDFVSLQFEATRADLMDHLFQGFVLKRLDPSTVIADDVMVVVP